ASPSGSPYRFTGRRLDAETGLYYYRARYYSPAQGRFLSPDPIGYGDDMNMYAYVGNDPINFVDPSGLLAEKTANLASEAWDVTKAYAPVVGQSVKNALVSNMFAGIGEGDYTAASLVGGGGVGATLKALKGGAKLLSSSRQKLLDSATDKKLLSRIEKMYRENAQYGDGSTADAIRYELKTGKLLSPKGHVQKGNEMLNGLAKDIKSGRLDETDLGIAKSLVKDLKNALSGK
ncbi:MAG: RHS repeat-associated core domain-containing protein, partial [Lentilitoribacter sp.]